MPLDRIAGVLDAHVAGLEEAGTTKGAETVVTGVRRAEGDRGPRFLLEGEGDKEFMRMNSNSYLGLGLHPEVIRAEEAGSAEFGAGPGAVRFISGSYSAHVDLERKLAQFHARESAMIFSSAYASIVSTISPLVTSETVLISDALNHNCIIIADRVVAQPHHSITTGLVIHLGWDVR